MTTVCLALGIGANAAVFSLLNARLLRDLPLPDPGRLIVLRRGPRSGFSFPDYTDLKTRFANSGELLATPPLSRRSTRTRPAGAVGESVVHDHRRGAEGVLRRFVTEEDEYLGPVANLGEAASEYRGAFAGSRKHYADSLRKAFRRCDECRGDSRTAVVR